MILADLSLGARVAFCATQMDSCMLGHVPIDGAQGNIVGIESNSVLVQFDNEFSDGHTGYGNYKAKAKEGFGRIFTYYSGQANPQIMDNLGDHINNLHLLSPKAELPDPPLTGDMVQDADQTFRFVFTGVERCIGDDEWYWNQDKQYVMHGYGMLFECHGLGVVCIPVTEDAVAATKWGNNC